MRLLGGALAALALLVVGTADADADLDGADITKLQLEAELRSSSAAKKSLGRHVTDKLTLWGNEVGGHVNLLTLDMVDMRFNARKRRAAIRVGALAERLGLQINGDIKVRSNVARVKSSIALGLNGRSFRLDLPVFEVVSQNVRGERSVELRLPIIEGRF